MTNNKHSPEIDLFIVAQKQNGYFTSKQAAKAGYKPCNFPYYVETEKWSKIMRGIYRLRSLRNYPTSDDEQYIIWSLWIGEKDNIPIGVYSHLTALKFYDVSEAISDKLHITVPENFQIRKKDRPEILVLHKGKLAQKDIRYFSGYAITTLDKTLVDIAESRGMDRDQFIHAVIKAYKKKYISLDFILQTPEFSNFISEITKYLITSQSQEKPSH